MNRPDFSRIPGADRTEIVMFDSMYQAIEQNNMWEYICNHEGSFNDNSIEEFTIIHETYRRIIGQYYYADMVPLIMSLMRRLIKDGWEVFCNCVSPSPAHHIERSNAE